MQSISIRFVIALTMMVTACGGPISSGAPPQPYANATSALEAQVLAALQTRGNVRLAILPLAADGDTAVTVGELVLEKVASRLSNAPNVTFVERDKLSSVLEEIALQQLIASEQEQLRVGKMAGAQILLAPRAAFLGDAVELTSRLLDVESGTSIAGFSSRILYDAALEQAVTDRQSLRNLRTSQEVMANFDRVRNGELAEAEAFFDGLSRGQDERRSVGLMGLAAVAHERAQWDRAQELCKTSQDTSDAPSYCWVLEGQIARQRGAIERAEQLLSRALADSAVLSDWQKARAANTLGAMRVAKDDVAAAASFFDKAVSLDPTNAEAVGNQARLLETTGDLAGAVTLYQRGLKANPDDQVLALLLRDAQMRANFAADHQRQEKITSMAQQLVANKAGAAAKATDDWTSRAVTVTLLPLEEKGAPSKRLGESAFVEASLRGALEEVPGVQIVDRQLLSTVLGELQIANSALADPSTALKVGRVMAARALLGGSIVRMQGESQITLKLIDTETTRILASVNEIYDAGARLSAVAQKVSHGLQQKVRRTYPLRGLVTTKRGTRVRINIGESVGVSLGQGYTIQSSRAGPVQAQVVELDATSAWLEVGAAGKGIKRKDRAELQ